MRAGAGRRDTSPDENTLFFLENIDWGHCKLRSRHFFVGGCVVCAACGVTTSLVAQGWQVRADMPAWARWDLKLREEGGERVVLSLLRVSWRGRSSHPDLAQRCFVQPPSQTVSRWGSQLRYFNLLLYFANGNVL